jgi:hypothetical protein
MIGEEKGVKAMVLKNITEACGRIKLKKSLI